jgi:phosphate-selective porin OprO/OprP
VALAILLVIPGESRGADDPPTAADHEQRIRELEETIRQLNTDTRKLEVPEEERGKARPVAGYQDGFFVQSSDGSYQLKLGGYTHFDGRFFIDEENRDSTTQFTFRRARLDFTGTVAKYFKFRLMPDFAGSSLVLQEAWVDATYLPWAQIRAGKMKTPYGIERLQSATAIYFIERAISDNLVPNRDLGMELFGDLWLGRVSYFAGIFNGTVDGGSADVDLNDDFDFAGRVFLHPFRVQSIKALQGLGIGIAGTYGREDGSPGTPDLPRFRTSGRATFFRYVTDSPPTPAGTTIADGVRYRYSPQVYYYWGPFGALGEFNTTVQDVERNRVEDSLTFRAWQLQTSYVLTGEDATYRGVTPAQPFNPFNGKWGAFQVALRYSQLDVDDDAFDKGFANPDQSAEKAISFAVGANWYLNRNIKLALNYERTWFGGGAAGGADRKSEDVILTRVQLVL